MEGSLPIRAERRGPTVGAGLAAAGAGVSDFCGDVILCVLIREGWFFNMINNQIKRAVRDVIFSEIKRLPNRLKLAA